MGVVWMVEPVTITAVALLAAYLKGMVEEAGSGLADHLGEGARSALRRLHEAIKHHLSHNDYQEETLRRFEERPNDERRQRALDDVLSEATDEDPEFARELADLVAEVRKAVGVHIKITESGAVAIGGDVRQYGHNVAGRDLTTGGSSQHSGDD